MKEIKISRSKIELFMDCPRCFWLETKYKIKRPEKISGGFIGAKYDPILKKSFDEHRKNNTTPLELTKYEFSLFNDFKKLNDWRRELAFYHYDHKIIYYGKIDDVLVNKNNELVPFDFKTTISKEFQVYENHKRQLEIYGYLLKQINEKVANFGIFYVVKIDINENFEKIEEREIVIQENLDYDFYDELLEKLKDVYFSDKEPEPSSKCEFCQRDFKIIELWKKIKKI